MRLFAIEIEVPDHLRCAQWQRRRSEWAQVAEKIKRLKLGKSLKMYLEVGTDPQIVRRSVSQYLHRQPSFSAFKLVTRLQGQHLYFWKELR